MKTRLPIPPKRTLPWSLRPLSSAETALSYDSSGRMVMTISHGILRGVTPEKVAWWFRNIGGEIEIGDQRLDRYLAWHPTDHIRWELARPAPDGTVGVGSRFHIVEAFGADPRFYIDIVDTVIRLDASGITLVNQGVAGIEISRLNHDFIAVEDGTLYRSTLTIGIGGGLVGRAVNPLIHRFAFTEAMGRAWLRHNIEEVGLLEHIIPLLYGGNSEAPPRRSSHCEASPHALRALATVSRKTQMRSAL
jgi:hypothetical protein